MIYFGALQEVPKSPGLTPCGNFFWMYVKDTMYILRATVDINDRTNLIATEVESVTIRTWKEWRL